MLNCVFGIWVVIAVIILGVQIWEEWGCRGGTGFHEKVIVAGFWPLWLLMAILDGF